MRSEFVVADGEATELLEAGEQVFDQMPGAIAVRVPRPGLMAVTARRNHRLGTGVGDGLDEGVRVVTLVGDHGGGRGNGVQQRVRLRDVGLLRSVSRNFSGLPKASAIR